VFVPTSSTTADNCGGTPAQAYRARACDRYAMPSTPRSPRPRMRSPSVTTIETHVALRPVAQDLLQAAAAVMADTCRAWRGRCPRTSDRLRRRRVYTSGMYFAGSDMSTA